MDAVVQAAINSLPTSFVATVQQFPLTTIAIVTVTGAFMVYKMILRKARLR